MRIERVESLDDERLADYAGVRDPVRLRHRGAFLAEGRLVLRTVLSQPRFRLRSVLGTSATLAWLEAQPGTLPAQVPFFHIDARALEQGSGYRFHQGCLAAVDVPTATAVDDLLRGAGTATRPFVLLEGVSNPDNVGAIFRTAAAFEAPGVVLDSACASPLYRKAVRTSMGAVLRVPFHHGGRSIDHLVRMRQHLLRTVALTPSTQAASLEQEAALSAPRALILGAEGDGVCAATLGAVDAQARIPIDLETESLNVAAAAAIALYRLAGPASPG